MKTVDDIITAYQPHLEYNSYYHEAAIRSMMKEFAKQWVDKTAEELNLAPRWEACVDMLKRNIDQQ